MRALSSNVLKTLMSQETGESVIFLLTFTHPQIADAIRVCDELLPDGDPLTSNGQQFIYFPFRLEWPEDIGDKPSQSTLTFSNVLGDVMNQLVALSEPPDLLTQMVLASDPNTISIWWSQQVLNVDFDAMTVTMTLGQRSILAEPYPAKLVSILTFPGIYR